MIPQKPSQPGPKGHLARSLPSRFWRTRLSALLGLVVAASSLAGCTASYPPAPDAQSDDVISLPELSATQALRDEVARVDAAVLQRAVEADLPAVAKAAEERLEAVGGIWEPWVDLDFEERPEVVVEQPMSIDTAPEEDEDLANFMLDSAASQLVQVTSSPDLTVGERLTLAGVLSGRIVSGTVMREEIDRPVSASAYRSVWETTVLPDGANRGSTTADQSPQSGELPTFDWVRESSALNAYDCVAGTLLTSSSPGSASVANARAIANRLEERVVTLRALGAHDIRGPRCLYEADDGNAILRQLVYTDLDLIGSDVEVSRNLAGYYLFEDSVLWAKNFPDSANRVSVPLALSSPIETQQSAQSGN